MDSDGALLRTEKLTRAYGSLIAVDRVDMAVRRGELRSIIGPNGAGKTTFFRLISGEVVPTSGRIWFRDREVTGLPQHAMARLGIGRSFHFWSRADQLVDVRDKALGLLRTMGLDGKAQRLAAHLSHGEKRHLELAIALAADPVLLLLDEPTAGMSPEETDETIMLIRELAAGRTIVLVEHKMKLVMRISDRITVLHQGQVLADGTPEEIRANELVQRTYLGASR